MARNRKRRQERLPEQPADASARPRSATASALRHDRHQADEDLLRADLQQGGGDEPASEPPAGAGDAEYDEYEAEPDLRGDDDDELAGGREGRSGGPGGGSRGEGAIVPARSATPAPWLGARVLQFLQGSWRELQRVQWPDRPQVMQATGVVIGFVIVAGLFLGVSDFVATKVVNFILK